MPFVPVPKDLSNVKTKIALNLTKRQLICFSIAAAVGVPVYLLSKSMLGNSNAVLLMIGVMMPFFFFAMYEKDGQPAEKILRNYIRARFLVSKRRIYKTENMYKYLEEGGKGPAEKNKKRTTAGKKTKSGSAKREAKQGQRKKAG